MALRPTHAAANLVLGRGLLERGDAEGEARLRAILDLHDNELIPEACGTLAQHFQANGQETQLHEIRATLRRYHAAQAAAQQERSVVSVKDTLAPADLEASDQIALHEVLSRDPDLAEAYVVRKRLSTSLTSRFSSCASVRSRGTSVEQASISTKPSWRDSLPKFAFQAEFS